MRLAQTAPRIVFCLAVGAGGLVASCRRGGSDGAGAPAGPEIDVTLVGCDAVAKDVPCEVVDGQGLTVVVDAKTPVRVSAYATAEVACAPAAGTSSAGSRAGSHASEGGGGGSSPSEHALLRLVLPAGARAVCVEASHASATATTTKRVALVPTRRPSWLLEANRLRRAGDPARAEAIALAHARDPGQDGARAAALLGRLALARGASDEAARLLRDAVAREAGGERWSEEADDRFALAYTLATHAGRSSEAEDVLAADVLDGFAEARARRPYYLANAAHHAGDPRRGLARVEEALSLLARLGMDEDVANAEELEGLLLWRIGRAEEARDLFVALDRRVRDTTAPCTRATRLVNAAQASMQAWEDAGRPAASAFGPAEARDLAREALDLGDTRCPGGLRHANAAVALAEASEALGDPASARAHLEDARRVAPHPAPWFRRWWHEVMGRVLLAEKRPREASNELEVALSFASSATARWSIARTRAVALELQGRDQEAALAYEAAEAALDEIASLVPFGEGQALAASTRHESARGLVALLVRRGEPQRALDVARRARARVLASMTLLGRTSSLEPSAQRRVEAALDELRRARADLDRDGASDWALPASAVASRNASKRAREADAVRALDAALEAARRAPAKVLPPLDPAELVLFLDVAGGELRVLSAHRGVYSAHRIVVPAPAALSKPDETFARALLDPLATALEHATRVRVLSAGDAALLEVHALGWRGGPLARALPVVYGLDLPASAPSSDVQAPAHGARKGALVVADPTGDLPGARAESERVVAALRAAGAEVTLLFQSQGGAARVRSALEGARFFHYAGHATAGGRDGRDSALVLAEHTRLTVADIVALRSAPDVVVLSACEGARAESALVSSLGLAHAFVVAGSKVVVAPLRRVDDGFAVRWSAALHEHLHASDDLPGAITKMLRAGPPDGDWSAFRVLVR